MKNIRLFAFLATLLSAILMGCDIDEHNYSYVAVNLSGGDIVVRHTALNDTAKTDTLSYGEQLTIALRNNVKSRDVWDVETSVSMLMVKSISAISLDSTKKTEELCYRKFWTGPEDNNGHGTYQLLIDDATLALSRQDGYVYKVRSPFDGVLRVSVNLASRSSKIDTTFAGKQDVVIGKEQIYTFDESMKGTAKYKIQKISGMRSVTLWMGDKYKNLNLSKDTAYFETGKDTCTLVIPEGIFD